MIFLLVRTSSVCKAVFRRIKAKYEPAQGFNRKPQTDISNLPGNPIHFTKLQAVQSHIFRMTKQEQIPLIS